MIMITHEHLIIDQDFETIMIIFQLFQKFHAILILKEDRPLLIPPAGYMIQGSPIFDTKRPAHNGFFSFITHKSGPDTKLRHITSREGQIAG